MKGIEGKVCIVTGGGSGLGRACAVEFAKAGAKVIIFGRTSDKLEETVKIIEEEGGEAASLPGNHSSEEDVKKLLEFTLSTFGKPQILVNNAADREEFVLHEMSMEEWDRVIKNNLEGCFNCTRIIIPEIIRAGGGSIINVASAMALRGTPLNAAYSAAKGGVLSFTIATAAEYASRDVRINAVIPGAIKTERYKATRLKKEAGFEKKLIRHIPQGRLGRPEEVARAIMFLSSDDASYITGAALPVDGGYCTF